MSIWLNFCRSVPPELLRSFFGFVSDSFFSKLNQNIDKKFDVDAVQNIFVRYSLACTLRHLHLHIRKTSGQKIRLNSETPLCWPDQIIPHGIIMWYNSLWIMVHWIQTHSQCACCIFFFKFKYSLTELSLDITTHSWWDFRKFNFSSSSFSNVYFV